MSLQSRLLFLQGWGLTDLPLRETFSPAHPLARRDVPFAQARGSLRPRVARAQKIISLHPLLTVLIPRIALFDRPEHRFFEFLQRDVLRIAQGLQFLVEIVERLDRSLIRNLAER